MAGVKHKRGESCIRVKTAIGAEAVKVAERYRAVKGLSERYGQRTGGLMRKEKE